jgi:hypothetical protein
LKVEKSGMSGEGKRGVRDREEEIERKRGAAASPEKKE